MLSIRYKIMKVMHKVITKLNAIVKGVIFMKRDEELRMQLKKTRRQNTAPDALNKLRTTEAANYMLAEKEFGQQNENNQTT